MKRFFHLQFLEKIPNKFHQFLKKKGKTIILATHMKEDLNNLCDTVFKIENYTLKEESGKQFDPKLASAMLDNKDIFRKQLAWFVAEEKMEWE